MTSEVALMNRSAVVLAADSASTVNYWNPDRSKHEQRYFKRVNKIFNIVSNKPVGLMTYAAGSLQGMPWEVLAKAYRDARIGRSRPQLPEYADDLFEFLAGNQDIFPEDSQHDHLVALVSESVARIGYGILLEDSFKNEADAKKKAAIAFEFIARAEANIAAGEFINDDAKGIYTHIEKNKAKDIIARIKGSADGKVLLNELDEKQLERIALVAITGVFKRECTPLEYTGIVVAGYGEKQYLPQLEQFRVFGLFNNKLIRTRLASGCTSIRHNNNSEIVPIAQSTMTNTFRLGADLSTLEEIDGYANKALDELLSELVKAGHLAAIMHQA
jgi:hypothetical protein